MSLKDSAVVKSAVIKETHVVVVCDKQISRKLIKMKSNSLIVIQIVRSLSSCPHIQLLKKDSYVNTKTNSMLFIEKKHSQ